MYREHTKVIKIGNKKSGRKSCSYSVYDKYKDR